MNNVAYFRFVSNTPEVSFTNPTNWDLESAQIIPASSVPQLRDDMKEFGTVYLNVASWIIEGHGVVIGMNKDKDAFSILISLFNPDFERWIAEVKTPFKPDILKELTEVVTEARILVDENGPVYTGDYPELDLLSEEAYFHVYKVMDSLPNFKDGFGL
jgi:hypothetical protein